ncbi:MAG: nuoL [Rickettsiaceae bacterium]|nr:nuoL [Rickettsiaceae bacterium]
MITIATIFLPLISSIICGLFSSKISHKQAGLISNIALFATAICAAITFVEVGINNDIKHIILLNWIDSDLLKANWTISVDHLSSIMLVVVTFVSALVHLYSIGYMETDTNLPRFMSYLSLFTFFMLLLVTADNFIQLFCGWEGVGFCSYLLIGFWYKKTSACNASIKAFIVNRVADFAFILAICLIFASAKSVEFSQVFGLVEDIQNSALKVGGYNLPLIEVISMLMLIGCMVTCLFAATIAITQNDIKKIIAYSTCSQLGYMFFACGLSVYNAGIFHLFTHAFFKALLFLGAGSVIHAVSGEQDIKKMGGVWKKIPLTYSLFWIGSLAIAGVFPLAGYFSKDFILEAAYASNTKVGHIAFWCGIVAAFFTAFYSWRLLILVFHGESKLDKNALKHVHESPISMLVPMIILSIGAIFSGVYGVYGLNIEELPGYFKSSIIIREQHNYLETMHHLEWYIKLLPSIAGILGILLAYLLYTKLELVDKLKSWLKPLYLISYNKYYIDEIYNSTIVPLYKIKAEFAKIIDINIIDKLGPDGAAISIKKAAEYISKLQTGFIFSYAFFLLIGLVVPINWFMKIIST